MRIDEIREALNRNRVRITDHADEEARNDGLTFDEIARSTLAGEVIENYPDDHPYPSCLVLGRDLSGDPIHSVWAYNETTEWAVLITVYRPDPKRWTDWRKRKKP